MLKSGDNIIWQYSEPDMERVVTQGQDNVAGETDIMIPIDALQAGTRFDHLLVQSIAEVSRARIISSIRSGLIQVDGEPRKPSYRLKAGECVRGSLLEQPALSVAPEQLDFPILFEDSSLLVISKPPGLVVHPGSGNSSGTLVNGLVYHCEAIAEVGDSVRPGIVHRLDKDTSGVMVAAKDANSHRLLVEAFKAREVEKEYIAVVHGILPKPQGRIVAPIGRHPVNRQKMAVQEQTGRYAVSNWQVLDEYGSRYSKVRVQIETGRTHQIRVHMAHLGHPVAGDIVYGPGRNTTMFPRQMLHSWKISFPHPISGEKLSFSAPVWEDMCLVCERLAMDVFSPPGE